MKRTILLALLAGGLLAAAPALAQSDAPPPPPPGDDMGPPPPDDGGMGGPMHGHWGHHPGQFMFDAIDTNHDGKISKDELAAFQKKHFDALSGGKAEITKEAFIDAHMAELKDRAALMFDRLDTNHDGKLSEAELAARGETMFARLDKNHDGVISKDELPHWDRKDHWDRKGPPPPGGDEKPGQ